MSPIKINKTETTRMPDQWHNLGTAVLMKRLQIQIFESKFL